MRSKTANRKLLLYLVVSSVRALAIGSCMSDQKAALHNTITFTFASSRTSVLILQHHRYYDFNINAIGKYI